jgi:hypothetical protein
MFSADNNTDEPKVVLPSKVAAILTDHQKCIEEKDKCIDLAIKREYKFTDEEKEKIKKFLSDSITSKYYSDEIKLKLIQCFDKFEILLKKDDPIYDDMKILILLTNGLREKLICLFYQQGLYDEKYRDKLLDTVKSTQWPSNDKMVAIVKLFSSPPLSELEVKKIAEKYKTYPEYVDAVDKLIDSVFDNGEERFKASQVVYETVTNNQNILLNSGDKSDVFDDQWRRFANRMACNLTALEDEDDRNIFVEMAEKRLSTFAQFAHDKHLIDNADSDYRDVHVVFGYLVSLNDITNDELFAIPKSKMPLFLNFIRINDAFTIRLSLVSLNRYFKGKPYFDDKKDWIAYLKAMQQEKK